jgi:hypothetical protein
LVGLDVDERGSAVMGREEGTKVIYLADRVSRSVLSLDRNAQGALSQGSLREQGTQCIKKKKIGKKSANRKRKKRLSLLIFRRRGHRRPSRGPLNLSSVE